MECNRKNEKINPNGVGGRSRVVVVKSVPDSMYYKPETEPQAGMCLLIQHWIYYSGKHGYSEIINELQMKLQELKEFHENSKQS